MSILQALIMGLVQGLTEFLPVSSSAHLVFADHFLQLHMSSRDTVSFDVLLHVGTLLAVLVYFRQDVWLLLRGFGQLMTRRGKAWRENAYSRLAALLLIGTVPAAIAGKTLKPFFEQAFMSVPGTAAFLLGTAIMLFFITRKKPGERSLEGATWKDALVIGAAQMVAILPGISRSGSTITAGLLRGMDREAAPRFSFLLSIPIIMGGALLDFKETLETGFTLPWAPVLVGFVASAISGYLAVVWLLSVVRKGRLDRFGYYCAVVGVGMLAYWNFLVPRVTPDSLVALENGAVVASVHAGELAPVEVGRHLTFSLQVTPGMVPVRDVVIEVPRPGVHGHGDMEQIKLLPVAGNARFESESTFRVTPLDGTHAPSDDDDVPEITVILRNQWGIENSIRLKMRVQPESLQRRTA